MRDLGFRESPGFEFPGFLEAACSAVNGFLSELNSELSVRQFHSVLRFDIIAVSVGKLKVSLREGK
jgi:hypothetical protein